MNGLTLLQLLTVCVVSEASSEALWQFANMIVCVQPNVNPLQFNDYGCYCGIGGSGKPVDDLDRCCQTHDDCYGDVEKNCSSSTLQLFVQVYGYTCTSKTVTCTDTNSQCHAALCECDRAAAHCFGQTQFHPEHKHLDPKLCQ